VSGPSCGAARAFFDLLQLRPGPDELAQHAVFVGDRRWICRAGIHAARAAVPQTRHGADQERRFLNHFYAGGRRRGKDDRRDHLPNQEEIEAAGVPRLIDTIWGLRDVLHDPAKAPRVMRSFHTLTSGKSMPLEILLPHVFTVRSNPLHWDAPTPELAPVRRGHARGRGDSHLIECVYGDEDHRVRGRGRYAYSRTGKGPGSGTRKTC